MRAEPSMIGQRIHEDLEIVALIRTTASGNIYRARQRSLDRDVAVKLLDSHAANEAALARFLAEAQRLAALHHPNVVQIYSLGNYQGNPFVVMEALAGRTLAELLSEARLGVDERLRLMICVARGLQAIHGLGIVHRDLSPNHIVVDGPSTKIADFGLAADVGTITYASQVKSIAETADYLSPEQIENREVTFASDLFSFGVILYETLSGVHPFHAEHPMSLLYNIVHRAPKPLRERLEDLPERVSALVMRCLEKDPARRPQSMAEVERELAAIEPTPGLATATAPAPRHAGSNPYGSRVMIRRREDFFGRKREIRWIYARLDASPPGSVSVVGDRRIGKSSLLNHVYMRVNREAHLQDPAKMVVVFVDLSQWPDLTIESFAKALLRLTALEVGDRVDVSGCSHDLDGIRAMVERLQAAGCRLAILLDEFERITNNPSFPLEFFAFLRFLANHYDVAYVTSSARDLQSLCHDQSISDSPFFNIFSALHLSAFQPDEARELIRVPSQRVGHPLEPHTERILELSGPFPFFIQLACWHALDSLQGGAGADFEAIRRAFYQDALPHYQHLWESFDAAEREVLTDVISGRKVPESHRHVLDELANRGYVHLEGGTARIFASTFRDFVPPVPAERPRRSAGSRRRVLLLGAAAAGVAALLVFEVPGRVRSVVERRRGMVPVEVSAASPAVTAAPDYENSRALVIGASTYREGWPRLPGVADDVRQVSDVLRSRGFHVESILDPDAAKLRTGLEEFVNRSAMHENDRLLVYFAGHGYTERTPYGEDMGYIVPVDAPLPRTDLQGFLRRALTMNDIEVFARKIRAKHALFVFDACFAGTIFTVTRGAPPPHIADQMARPVRQFITSGSAGETVPDKSTFAEEFVAGLQGEADLNGDGYVTGSEFGQFLYEKVIDYTKGAQRPQYGKLRDPKLDKGDFVFALKAPAVE